MATKKIVEKKTGEKYASKAAMKKHEKSESKTEMKKEYGKPKPPTKQVAHEQSHSSKMENKNSDKVNSVVKKNIPIKQIMGAVGLGAGTKEGKYATEKVKEAGRAYVKFSKDLDAQSNRRGATQLKSVAKKQVAAKKAPGKMKKC